MDIMMPQMNGKEALQIIRELEKTMGVKGVDEVKAIMITALGDPKTVFESFFKSGATSYLVKPFKRGDIYKVISSMGFNLNIKHSKKNNQEY
jgi:two-component system chemotaxis response regulator CheY